MKKMTMRTMQMTPASAYGMQGEPSRAWQWVKRLALGFLAFVTLIGIAIFMLVTTITMHVLWFIPSVLMLAVWCFVSIALGLFKQPEGDTDEEDDTDGDD